MRVAASPHIGRIAGQFQQIQASHLPWTCCQRIAAATAPSLDCGISPANLVRTVHWYQAVFWNTSFSASADCHPLNRAELLWLDVGHPLLEVRHRSLQNLFFKVNHGLSKQAAEVSQSQHVTPDDEAVVSIAVLLLDLASQDGTFLQNLLSWFQHNNGDASDCAMLDMLRKLAQQPGVAVKLCGLGLVALLTALQEECSPEVQRSAGKTLTAVMLSDPAPDFQPFSSNHISPHNPRSRCQSNSPQLSPTEHQKRHSQRTNMFQGRSMECLSQGHSYGRSRDDSQLASQAFGSQQGKPGFCPMWNFVYFKKLWVLLTQFVQNPSYAIFCTNMTAAAVSC